MAAAVFGVFLFGSPAAAQQSRPMVGGYVVGGAGLSFLPDVDTRTNLGASDEAASGFLKGLRFESELGYRNDIDNGFGTAQPWSVMTNALYDFNTGTRFTPYVGLGLGGTRLNFNNAPAATTSINDTDTALAYQGMAGVGYQLDTNLRLDLGYRYFGIERPSFRTGAGGAVDSEQDHAVMFGLRYQFDRR